MKLYFIRHGQTDWNLKGKIQGSYDCELNNTGIIQAEELSKRVLELNYRFTKIYSSLQKRAAKTAQILSEATMVDYIPLKGLEEMNFGDWEGLSWEDIKVKFPTEYKEWFTNRRYTKSPKGESYQDVLERVLTVMHEIINMNTENVVIVTHGAVIMCLQCYLMDVPFNEMMKFNTENTAIIEIDSELFNRD